MDFVAGALAGLVEGGLLLWLGTSLSRRRSMLGTPLFLALSYSLVIGIGFAAIRVNEYIVDRTTVGSGHAFTFVWVMFYVCACVAWGVQNLRQQKSS